MAEEFLYRPQIRPRPEKVRGERVPQGVRRRALGEAQAGSEPLHKRLNLARAERRSPIGAEQCVVGLEAYG